MFDQLSAEILASLIKGFPRTTRTKTTTTTTTTTTKQNVDPAVHFVYSRVKMALEPLREILAKQIFRLQLLAVYVLLVHNCGECRIRKKSFTFHIIIYETTLKPQN
jgi:hypothetical protein